MAKLYFRYGAMNCGKSTSIIQVAYNYEEKNKKIMLIKPSTDTKGNDLVMNRSGLSRKVDKLISPTDEIYKYIKDDISAILVDEAQFLTEKQVRELYEITKIKDIPVLCYGLRADFKMEPFSGSPTLLLLADTIEELKTICACGKKATQNIRKINGIPTFEGNQVAIDGAIDEITYESVCGKCYLELKNSSRKD